jgi:hypothetical protein
MNADSLRPEVNGSSSVLYELRAGISTRFLLKSPLKLWTLSFPENLSFSVGDCPEINARAEMAPLRLGVVHAKDK